LPFAAPVHRPAGYRNAEARKREVDQRRGKTAARGYDGAWQKLSKEYRAQHPFCECDEHKGLDERALTQVVDHRLSIEERPDLRLEWSNLRGMKKTCHDRHTAKTQGFARGNT
jgi:5-methylcytosine-specific restriction enzyme A